MKSGRPDEILRIVDACCESFTFPMLDNGYFYLAAARLSLFRSLEDWALVIETFGFSPRQGTPSTHIQTFASRLHDRDPPDNHPGHATYENYLAHHPHDEFRWVDPFGAIDWGDPQHPERVLPDLQEVMLRGRAVRLPELEEYVRHGIHLKDRERAEIFEACRYLAGVAREDVLATATERRVSVLPEMQQLLVLDEWHHPNVVENERPSRLRTFQQLARVLDTGDVRLYAPTDAPNTHWRNWPDGGAL